MVIIASSRSVNPAGHVGIIRQVLQEMSVAPTILTASFASEPTLCLGWRGWQPDSCKQADRERNAAFDEEEVLPACPAIQSTHGKDCRRQE